MSKKAEQVAQDELFKALETLDDLNKSVTDEKKDETGAEDLLKSAEAAAAGLEALAKSDDVDGKDGKGEEEGEGKKKEEEEKKAEEEKKKKEEEDKVKKSQDDSFNFDEELVKASEEYAALRKSVEESTGNLQGQMAILTKSIQALLSIALKQVPVMVHLSKSVKELGAAPVGASEAKLGLGSKKEETLEKSTAEIRELLHKAVDDEKVDASWLGKFAARGPAILPEDVRTAIGL